MNILIIEPFFGGSHAAWAGSVKKYSRHDVEIMSLPGRHWKWRMHGAAVTTADRCRHLTARPDLILITDMLDVAVFRGLLGKELSGIPVCVYFHENQLSYPWSPQDKDVRKGRDFHYGWINWTTVIAADKVLFNSAYNMESFFSEVAVMLKAMPDNRNTNLIPGARNKSSVCPLGIDLEDLYTEPSAKQYETPVILWNHRWEYDKNPGAFFRALKDLKKKGIIFKLITCGEVSDIYPQAFDLIRSDFAEEIIHFGYAPTRKEYIKLLQMANVIPVTNIQEFFGQSVIEAIAAGCYPLMPDRLAYPGHFPEKFHKYILYDKPAMLNQKLAGLCSNLKKASELVPSLQEIVMKYDWKIMAGQYDKLFEEIISDHT